MQCDIFTARRRVDPQGVIDDLLGQITRQAQAISELTAENAELRRQVKKLTRPNLQEINDLLAGQ